MCRGLNGSSQWKECISDKDRRMGWGQTHAANKLSQRSRWWVILVAWQPPTEVLAFQLFLSDCVPAWGIKHISQSMSREDGASINAATCKVITQMKNIQILVVSIYIKCKYPNVLEKAVFAKKTTNVTENKLISHLVNQVCRYALQINYSFCLLLWRVINK